MAPSVSRIDAAASRSADLSLFCALRSIYVPAMLRYTRSPAIPVVDLQEVGLHGILRSVNFAESF